VEAAKAGNPGISEFDTSCFTGHYVTGDISDAYLEQVSLSRNDETRSGTGAEDDMMIDLSNSA